MEMLHYLWNICYTEDENIIKIIILLMNFLESFATLRLLAATLNITYTNKQRNLYFISLFICTLFTTFIIPNKYSVFITLLVYPIIIKLIFKTSIIKCILSEIVIFCTTLITETLYIKLGYHFYDITLNNCINIPLYRFTSMIFVYITLLIISKQICFFKNNINTIDYINKKNKILIILNIFFILFCIGIQFYLLLFYNTVLPTYISLISLTALIAYAFISVYSIFKSINLTITKRELEQSELHNKSLELLYNNISAFKHDFSNIITALGGYINSNNMKGLSEYYDKILDECCINNNLSTLNPQVINNAAIYNILANKYYDADEKGITINLQVFINLNELKMDIYHFCRILGILLDNAVEAAAKCEEKTINIDIRDIKPKKYQSIMIENTYNNKNIDISKLSEKGYTSKTDEKCSHGIGLWQVSKIINKHSNVILDTTKDDTYFRQELIIYY